MSAAESRPVARLAGSALLLSAATGALGVAFLVGMFAGFAVGARSEALVLGRINDVLVLVAYLLAAPAVPAVVRLVRPSSRTAGVLGVAVGLGAIAAIVVLQLLLVAGALTFEEQVGPVSVALLAFGAWIVATGVAGDRTGRLRIGPWTCLLAALYLGYPLWALRVGRQLRGAHRVPGQPPTIVPVTPEA